MAWKGGGKSGGKAGWDKKNVDPACSVWIGGLTGLEASKDSSKALCEHMKYAGDCKWAEVTKKGNGIAVFRTPQDAMKAISTLNGSDFYGVHIQVDSWSGGAGGGAGGGNRWTPNGKGGGKGSMGTDNTMQQVLQLLQNQGGGNGGGKGSWGSSGGKGSWGSNGGKGGKKGWSNKKMSPADYACSVWVGNLTGVEATKDSSKALCEHMKQAGECKWAEISKKGSGIACFKSATEAQNAITILNGSVFQGVYIEVDAWSKQK